MPEEAFDSRRFYRRLCSVYGRFSPSYRSFMQILHHHKKELGIAISGGKRSWGEIGPTNSMVFRV